MIIKHKVFKEIYFSLPLLYRIFNLIPDGIYLKIVYYLQTGQKLNLKNPKTYNEKIQWLKLYDQNISYTKFADKIAAKEIVRKKIGGKYVIPTLGKWDDIKKVNFDDLPDKFVLKCTHDSGSNYICKDKSKIDYGSLYQYFEKRMSMNYYGYLREWQYKNIDPMIIAEPYIGDDELPNDYKFFCFNGIPKLLMVVKIKDGKRYSKFYNTKFEEIYMKIGNPNYEDYIELPDNIHEMYLIAKKLSCGFRHIRIDLYNINGLIFFGEFTFHHWSGMALIEPDEWNDKLGRWIDL